MRIRVTFASCKIMLSIICFLRLHDIFNKGIFLWRTKTIVDQSGQMSRIKFQVYLFLNTKVVYYDFVCFFALSISKLSYLITWLDAGGRSTINTLAFEALMLWQQSLVMANYKVQPIYDEVLFRRYPVHFWSKCIHFTQSISARFLLSYKLSF